jgi:hypothetical protein
MRMMKRKMIEMIAADVGEVESRSVLPWVRRNVERALGGERVPFAEADELEALLALLSGEGRS